MSVCSETPQIILAPMEGLLDAPMRDLLTRVGGIDRCVTEFVRISDRLLPRRTFRRLCPELASGGRTPAGVPVRVQLLGSDPVLLGEAALRAVELGAASIDLNFGCPAKTVNRSRGGSVLLREPELIHRIVAGVRQALPSPVPLSAKMRLGYEDCALMLDNARAIAVGGAEELCVHGRTKIQGYGGRADWRAIGRIREVVDITVVANGDIRSVADYLRCREESGCDHVMIGRGLVARPDLALQIRAALAGRTPEAMAWSRILALVVAYGERLRGEISARHLPGRIKQWLAMLAPEYGEARAIFDTVRTLRDGEAILAALRAGTQQSFAEVS